MRFYLAGPMTGKPGYNFALFGTVCEFLEEVMGLEVASPHEIDHGEDEETRGSLDHTDYMRAGLKLMLDCDAIILMDGWELSHGCVAEFLAARAAGLKIYFFDTNTKTLTTSATE